MQSKAKFSLQSFTKFIGFKGILDLFLGTTVLKVILMILIVATNLSIELDASTAKNLKEENLKEQAYDKTTMNSTNIVYKLKEGEVHPEILRILQARNSIINERLKELEERRRELDLLQSEIEARMQELIELEKKLEQISLEIGLKKQENQEKEKKQKEQEEKLKIERLQYLAEVYSAMEPARAAELLNMMDINDVALIFSYMKTKKVAPIMAQMAPDKASQVAKAMTSLKSNPTKDDNTTTN